MGIDLNRLQGNWMTVAHNSKYLAESTTVVLTMCTQTDLTLEDNDLPTALTAFKHFLMEANLGGVIAVNWQCQLRSRPN